ncbi:hypothetical protein [Curtanaerobium respiraculi]|uniref:hypothetical protein n=1 Tax=Curtanaerobium respiraculi TaxID=2949669 RepID=UPI0024B371F3|nr:hypothetical protein [Curtanaerobium respiraculi]
MCYYVEIQDLAANALIGLLDGEKGNRVTFKQLNDYGVAVVRKLIRNGRDAVLLASQEYVFGMRRECSDLFDVHHVDKPGAYIELKPGVEAQELVDRFYGAIPFEILDAMTDADALDALFEKAA